jgi:hypothetical protein
MTATQQKAFDLIISFPENKLINIVNFLSEIKEKGNLDSILDLYTEEEIKEIFLGKEEIEKGNCFNFKDIRRTV